MADTGMMPNQAAVVEGNVPAHVPSMSFNIGNSIGVSSSNSHNNPKVVTQGRPPNNNAGLVSSIRVVDDKEYQREGV